MYIYGFLVTIKFKESATEANLFWRAKFKSQVRILILFQLKTYLPCYYLLLVFWVAVAEWLAFSSPALKRVFLKNLIVFTLGAMVSSALYLIVVEVKHFDGFSKLGFFEVEDSFFNFWSLVLDLHYFTIIIIIFICDA